MRRLLADSLEGDDVVKWRPPDVPPETQKLRVAKAEIERGLLPPTPEHMRWCCTKLSVLPARDGQSVTLALFADNFIDACGDYPDDLWTYATLELLKTKTFRPSPAEFLKVVDRTLAERKRMLERVLRLLAGGVAVPKPAGPEPLEARLATMRDAWKRIGRLDRAAPHERELAALEGRQPQEWATAVFPREQRPEEREPPRPPLGPEMQAQTLIAVARKHKAAGRDEYAKGLLEKARALAPQLFEEASHG